MKEILKSIFDNSKERIKNPFIGSFIIAWIAFNWKPIFYLLFSSDIIKNKISFIEDSYISIWYNLFFPLIFALFYILLLPYLMWWFEELYSKAKKERLDNITDIEIHSINNKIKTTKRSLVLENVKAEHQETSELNNKIELLEAKVTQSESTINRLEKENKEIGDKLITSEQKVIEFQKNSYNYEQRKKLDTEYEFIRSKDYFPYFKNIGKAVLENRSLDDKSIPSHVVTSFQMEKFLDSDYTIFKFTNKGRYFWIKYMEDFILDSLSQY